MSYQNALPEQILKTKTVDAIFRAIRENRCPHGILFYGASAKILEKVAVAVSSEILGNDAENFIDFHVVRPANKSRTISIEDVSELVRQMHQSPAAGARKVAFVAEADRLGKDSANAFLKTLEEPPAGTFIFLTTTAVNRVLPTIRSRCLHFRIPGEEQISHPDWLQWRSDFEKWIFALVNGEAISEIGKTIFSAYALTTRLQNLVKTLAAEAWKTQEKSLPANVSEDQKDAMLTGTQRGMRRKILAEIQESALSLVLQSGAGTPFVAESAATCELLEKLNGLLELNAQEGTIFEAFLLSCMRIWAKKKRSA